MPKIFIGAGEESGDFLGSQVIESLRKKYPTASFIGIGGTRMERAGNFTSLFSMEELSLLGFVEILPHLFKLLWRLHTTTQFILQQKPDIVLSIDAGDFYFRLLKRLRKRDKNLTLMHLNAPSVWALQPGRAKKVAGFLNHLFALFPFEPPYFTKHNLPTTFVGHPLVDKNFEKHDLHLPKDALPITVLFGSRRQEVASLSHDFVEACRLLHLQFPNLLLLIPTFEKFHPHLEEALKKAGLSYRFISPEEKWSAFYISRAALAASGTVALELARAQLPFTIAYKLNFLTYMLAKKIVKTPFACLVNVLLGRKVIKEYIQHDCTPQNLCAELTRLLTMKDNDRAHFQMALEDVTQLLTLPSGTSSDKIAEVVGEYVKAK